MTRDGTAADAVQGVPANLLKLAETLRKASGYDPSHEPLSLPFDELVAGDPVARKYLAKAIAETEACTFTPNKLIDLARIRHRREIYRAVVAYREHGWATFPIVENGKKPACPNGFYDATTDDAPTDAWFSGDDGPAYNIGFCPENAGFCVVDVDPGAAPLELPEGPRASTPRGGSHHFYSGSLPPTQSKIADHVDTRGRSSYVLLPPSHVVYPDGSEGDYAWQCEWPFHDFDCPAIPEWIVERCKPATNEKRKATLEYVEDKPEALRLAGIYLSLQDQPVDGSGSDGQCYAVAARLLDFGLSTDRVLEMMQEWSGFDPDWLLDKINHAETYRQNSMGSDVPTSSQEAFGAAIAAGVTGAAEQPREAPQGAPRPAPANGDEIHTVAYSHDALAVIFAEKYRRAVRWVDAWGKWMQFDGQRWAEMSLPDVWNLMTPIARNLALEAETPSLQRALTSRSTIAGASDLARMHLPASHDTWDANPWILNTPGGAVDLKTGALRPCSPEMLCRKMTAIAPGGECPRWRQFLDEVTQGDAELQGYLQRLAGYALVGETGEQMLAFLYGTGGNGKGVFMDTLRAIVGDYGQEAVDGLLMETKSDRHSTELARMQGARLVTTDEVNEGQAWNEARLKKLTGGGTITARFMRQDDFEFQPQHTLIIAGNHKPTLHTVDEAIRRRFHMVPFTAKISPRDTHLAEKLKAEWPGILRWMIDGCLEWQMVGLMMPAAVLDATADYFESQDSGPDWLRDRCVVAFGEQSTFARLFDDYREYMHHNREEPKGSKQFGQWLDAQGFGRFKHGSVRGFQGISLQPRPRGFDE